MTYGATGVPHAIALNSASFGYRGTPVVHALDFSVPAGEAVLLLGGNGSGKSTVVKGLLGLTEHLGGTAKIFGHPIADRATKDYVGYVPQRQSAGSPIPSTVWEVVSSGRLTRKRFTPRLTAADRAATKAAIHQVGLADRTHFQVSKLSGGQQRRALIARALASEPKVLLMDEPTAGVDAKNQLDLVETLLALQSAGADHDAMTILIVSHEVGPLLPLAQRAMILNHGRKIFDGSVADLPAVNRPVVPCAEHDDHPEIKTTPGTWAPGIQQQ